MHKAKNSAIIVAAGSGSRFGSEIPKQFLPLNNAEIIDYSVNSFLNHPDIVEVIIVTSAEYFEHVSTRFSTCIVVLGGKSRQDSVHNGMLACSAKTDNVLVHDAARPLIPDEVIHQCLAALETLDGVAPAISPVDSMIEIEADGFRNLKRDTLKIVQTPQCFHIDILKAAHASGKIDTDEIGLVKQALPDAHLGFIQGSHKTIKVTHTTDLRTVERFLESDRK